MWNKGTTLKHQNRDKTNCAIGNNIGNPNFRARAADKWQEAPVAYPFFYFQEKIKYFMVIRGKILPISCEIFNENYKEINFAWTSWKELLKKSP